MNSKPMENEKEKSFFEMFTNGECKAEDIDTYIDKWHDEYNGTLKLYEYLGMTKRQYDDWLINPDSLLSMKPSNDNNKSQTVCAAKQLIKLAKELITDTPT